MFEPVSMPQNQQIWIPEINPSGSKEPDLDDDTLRGEEICQYKVMYGIFFASCRFGLLAMKVILWLYVF